jgi:hypothetical protein
MRQCRISCDISSQYFSHNTSGCKGEQNNKIITKKFFSFFVFWLIHVSCMHMSHSASSYNNPNVLQVAWNVKCFVSSTIQIFSKEVMPITTISRRQRKKRSLAARCIKYIRPTTFFPHCQADQFFSWIFQTQSPGKSVYTTFCASAFWTLYAK